MDPKLPLISTEVLSEIVYQRKRWGTELDDAKNTPWMWAAYMSQYATKWMTGTFMPLRPGTVDEFRSCMIKVAALAISAVDSLDRQREANGQAFYEQEVEA